MSKYKKPSYIIPTYNAFKFLKEAVESVFKQNLNIPFEVIICDDNSIDGTQELIKQLADNHPEIKCFLNTKNLGAPNNRNFAISKSEGDLIYMLDHDNILSENTIQKLIDELENSELEAASVQELYFFKGDITDHRGSWIYKYPKNQFTIQDYIHHVGSPAASNNYMYTRKAFEKTGGYPDRGARENMGFGLRLVATGTKIAIVPNTKYYHRLAPNSMWLEELKSNPQIANKNMALNFREFIDLFDEKSQRMIMDPKAKTEADSYINKHKLKLSEKGWQLTCGKEKYNFKFYKLKNFYNNIKNSYKKIFNKIRSLIKIK